MLHPVNDPQCGWVLDLPERDSRPTLTGEHSCDTLIIGAGYTGLSAARTLAEHAPEQSIIVLDAQRAGEGASSRNSGYLVDSTLNDGHLSDDGLSRYLEKYRLNLAGVDAVKAFVDQHNVNCDWNPCGKFHATSLAANEAKLTQFSDTLTQCDIEHSIVSSDALSSRLGTGFYRMAVHTRGGIMLHPGKLARAMVDHLPASVALHENTPVVSWQETTQGINVQTPQGYIRAAKVLFCTNGFLTALGLARLNTFPLSLTASLTRPLTDTEFAGLGKPEEWGVLSAQAMGATVRLTSDRRIMIRNTAEAHNAVNMSRADLDRRVTTHETGLQRRFPTLPLNGLIQSTWSGVTCISGNSANVFRQLSDRQFAAGCYNGGGIGLATLFGEQLALKSLGGDSEHLRAIEQRPEPNWLPPQPFLRWGVKARLLRDRIKAAPER
ncbi:NAD(P)/FAD-dependent oxidoreductase [Reinekea blandensis]|uniref:Glycine/D-amino acid oxidase deaminating n=1 Tax=Reinekea blandensis MED297 TaxID=314283 RepID=A4BF69_9GAMM|nr:FAD-binding oxidoreductase [Reinekea blandensis]EAR09182.1 Glycine/D-amino acid oxidase deaminating [Reinekea sp. MED297] [Reinekea blandensis MED297]